MRTILCATSVSIGYTPVMTKDSGLRIRVQRELREKCLRVCRAEDKAASQVIREFMRSYKDRREKARKHPDGENKHQGLSHEY